MMVVCSSALTTAMTVTMAPSFVGLTSALIQHYVILLPPLILRDTVRGDVGLATVPQQESHSQMPSQAYAKYALGPSQMSFVFES